MKNSSVMIQDFEKISSADYIPWEKLKNKTLFVTGGTGLIGLNIVKAVLHANSWKQLNMKIVVLVRNEEKAAAVFEEEIGNESLIFIKGDVENLPIINYEIDYIIHGASATSSEFFVNHPAETIHISVDGTRNILELARKKKVNGFVYLSSMEVYGHPEKGHIVTEKEVAGFDTANVRNCYPLSKQICESMCSSYAEEYGVPAMCIRLTQTFGPGVEFNDGRVFAEFMRSVVNKTDIILKTKGETERCYLYTADSVMAILTVLLKGDPKECYNAANPETYCSILQMAELVAGQIANNEIKVIVHPEDISNLGYASTLYMMLDTTKLAQLGWKAETGLKDMFDRMIESCK